MIRLLLISVLCWASRAEASWEMGLQAAYGADGAAGIGEVHYSPQGFWAVGAVARADAQHGLLPQLALRGSFELFKWVPRLTLRSGFSDSLTFGADFGIDYFVQRQISLRARAGWGSLEGFEGAAGIAWFPFD